MQCTFVYAIYVRIDMTECSAWGRHNISKLFAIFGVQNSVFDLINCKDSTKWMRTNIAINKSDSPFATQSMRRGKYVGDQFVHAHVVRGEITTVCGFK